MKKKFIIFTLCFTIIFSSINFKKSYADGGVISLPLLATISALAVGTDIVINNDDDLYDLGRMFFDYVDKHNSLTWDTVNALFSSSVAFLPNKLVSVDSKFLDIVKGFFDNTFSVNEDLFFDSSIPIGSSIDVTASIAYPNGVSIVVETIDKQRNYKVYYNDVLKLNVNCNLDNYIKFRYKSVDSRYELTYSKDGNIFNFICYVNSVVADFPYNGGYTWDNVENKKENNEIALPIPGDLGHLVGQGSNDFWNNTDNLVGDDDIYIPGVNNPSIDIDGDLSFPGVDSPDVPGVDSPGTDIPSQGLWSAITDYIIGLVVPSDTYWTDTWGGLYNNFTNSFPMVDMDGFDDLVTGEKKFPNIDINIMGSKGRVVNGDIVNSIVDWLRPIIAGFMMLCLMLFNYRKIYKLIRNSEPFEGIGKVENHAN